MQSEGTGFSWTPSLRGGTTLILVGGDARGNGTAGSSLNTVSSGINNDGSCLNSASPSSTPGSPVGGSYPTSTSGAGVGGSHGSTNIGAIVGGVIGALVLLFAVVLLIWFLRRRKQVHRKQKERPVDLLSGEDEGDETDLRGRRNELPQYYQPEPFMIPDPTLSTAGDHTDAGGRPVSGTSMTMSRSGTPDTLGFGYGAHGVAGSTTSGGGRKGGRMLRPVNVIQHDDAGPSEADKAEEVETVELPPAYTSVGKGLARGPTAGTEPTSTESSATTSTTDALLSTQATAPGPNVATAST